MIIDSHPVPEDKNIETDICIVGAGTAGLTLAKEFNGQDFNVCLLESGGLKPDRETQALYQGDNIGHPYFSLDSARARYFGGSTNRWHLSIGDDCSGARMRPLDAIDFEQRNWIPYSGWPFDKSHLDPWYDRAQEICKITPATYDVADWQDSEKSPPFTLNGDRVKTVIFKFGSRHPFLNEYAEELNISIPEDPILFFKPPSSLLDPEGTIIRPSVCQKMDYEAELAAVIKRKAKNITVEQVHDHVLGYTCFNDVTARDIQSKDGQWTRAKSFDTFSPVGPVISAGIDPNNLKIELVLNGEVKQSSHTSMMVYRME